MNIFGSNFLDKFEYKYIWVNQKGANMKTISNIGSDIREYEYKFKYYNTHNTKNISVYGYKSFISMQIIAHICHHIQIMVYSL